MNIVSKQYVYIFSNNEHEKIKIGKTNKHPQVRAEQLSKQTGSIGRFTCELFKEVKNSEYIEKTLHYFLREFHYEKEYYLLDLMTAKEFANKIVKDIEAIEEVIPLIIENTTPSIEARIKIIKKMIEKESAPKKIELLKKRLELLDNLLNYSS